MTFAYIRVSSRDQNPDMQLDLLQKAGYDRLYMEKESGKKRLIELEKCINDLREGDTILIYDIDRLGRTALNIIETVYTLQKKQVHIKSLHDNIDTTNFGGKLVVYVLSLLAEKEHADINTRCRDGRIAAMKRGKKFGRPKGSGDKDKAANCVILYNAGQSVSSIMSALNISRDSIYRYLQDAGVTPKRRNPNREG
jgi:DNA invertase Pin-like site-specific DNA recombinase